MIRVHRLSDVFDGRSRETDLCVWRDGLTVAQLVPRELRGREDIGAVLNGRPVLDFSEAIPDGAHVSFFPRPADPGTLTVSLLGKTLFSAHLGGTALALAQAGVFLANTAALYLLGRLLAPGAPSIKRGDQGSATYGFAGIESSRNEGVAVPITLGEMRTGGVVIQEWVDATAFPQGSTYHALILLSEGPIYAIGDKTSDNDPSLPFTTEDDLYPVPRGLQINGNPAENFRDVTVHVRLGDPDQEPIPGFEAVHRQLVVAQELKQTTTTGTGTPAVLVLDGTTYKVAATADPIWDEYGVAFDAIIESDEFVVNVHFPQGLIGFDSSGNQQLRGFYLLIRYRALDYYNNAVKTGGPTNDGWVRLPPEPAVIAARQTPFTASFQHPFFDPQTYAYPIPGEAAECDGVDDYFDTSGVTLPAAWQTAGTLFEEFTLIFWLKLDALPAQVAHTGYAVMEHLNATGTRGWRFFVESFQAAFGVWQVVPRFHLFVGTATPAEVPTFIAGTWPDTLGVDEWHHFAVTFKRNGNGTEEVYSLYWNGVAIQNVSQNRAFQTAGSTVELTLGKAVGAQLAGYSLGFLEGKVDEMRILDRRLAPGEIASDYAKGVGVYNANEANLVAGWHFDTLSGTTPDFSSNANDLTPQAGATITTGGGGIVQQPGSGSTAKRGKYRVEVMRINELSTNARTVSQGMFETLTLLLNETFNYAGRALIGISVEASEQLNTTKPTVTVLHRGYLARVWDGLSTAFPNAPATYSANPAWQFLALAVDTTIGLGAFYSLTTCDLAAIKEWADYCDELIYTKRGKLTFSLGEFTDLYFEAIAGTDKRIRIVGVPDAVMQNMSVTVPPNDVTPSDLAAPRFFAWSHIGFVGLPVVLTDINMPLVGGFAVLSVFADLGLPGTWQIVLDYPDGDADPWDVDTYLSSHATITGVAEPRERRFEYHGSLDTARPAWDRLLTLCSVGRAVPVRRGSILSVKYERPRSPVDLVSYASIVAGSFEVDYGDRTARENVLHIDIMAKDSNYERKPIQAEHPSIQGAVGSFDNLRIGQRFFEGITSRRQGIAQGMFMLNVLNDLKRTGSFRMGPEGLPYEPGDVLVVSHDLTRWGTSGRIRTADTSSSVKLDRDVTLATDVDHEIQVRDTDDGTYETALIDRTAIGSYPHTYAAGTAIPLASALSFIPAPTDPYVFARTPMLVQVTNTTLLPSLERQVEWIEYQASVYTDDGFPDLVTISPTA